MNLREAMPVAGGLAEQRREAGSSPEFSSASCCQDLLNATGQNGEGSLQKACWFDGSAKGKDGILEPLEPRKDKDSLPTTKPQCLTL